MKQTCRKSRPHCKRLQKYIQIDEGFDSFEFGGNIGLGESRAGIRMKRTSVALRNNSNANLLPIGKDFSDNVFGSLFKSTAGAFAFNFLLGK